MNPQSPSAVSHPSLAPFLPSFRHPLTLSPQLAARPRLQRSWGPPRPLPHPSQQPAQGLERAHGANQETGTKMLGLSQLRDSKSRPMRSEGTKDGAHLSNALSTGCLHCSRTNCSSQQREKTHLSPPGLWNSITSARVIHLLQLTLTAAEEWGRPHNTWHSEPGIFPSCFPTAAMEIKRIQRQLVALQREAVAGRVVPIAPPLLLQGFLAQDHVAGKGERGRAWDLGAGALGRPRMLPTSGASPEPRCWDASPLI